MEILLAVFVPCLVLLAICRARCIDPDFRSAAWRWFIPLTLVWLAPFWLTGKSPAPFDFLGAELVPWQSQAPRAFSAGNALLSDVPLQVVPWHELVSRSLRRGALPFFNRDAGSGSPLWENPQAAVLFPLTWMGALFSGFSWPLFAATAKILIALTGMYVFLRRERVSHRAALFGAIAYAFSTYSVAFLLFSHTNITSLLPWLLVAIPRPGWRGAALAAGIVTLLLIGGHPESVLHCAFVAIPYALRSVLPRPDRWTALLRLAAAALVGALIAAPAVLPFLHLLPQSERMARLSHEVTLADAPRLTARNLIPFILPAHFIDTRLTMPADNFNEAATQYAGLTTFTLFLLAIAIRAKEERFWIALFVVLSLLAFKNDWIAALVSRIPLVGLTLHGRLRFALALITAVVGARGVDTLSEHPRLVRLGAAAVGAAAVTVAIVSWGGYLEKGLVLLSVGTAVVTLAFLPLQRLLPLLVFADLAAVGMPWHPPVSRAWFYPQTAAISFLRAQPGPFRVLGIENALRPNTGAMLGIEDIGVHDPFSFEPYGALLERAGYDRRFYFNSFHRLPPSQLLDFLGVRFIIAPPDLTTRALEVAYRGRDAVIYANPKALPRFFVIPPAGGASLSLERYESSEAVVRIKADRETVIGSSEVALPGWHLLRNGEEWTLAPFNRCFLAWRAPAGESVFRLEYRPEGLELGVTLSAVGGALLLAMLWRRQLSAAE